MEKKDRYIGVISFWFFCKTMITSRLRGQETAAGKHQVKAIYFHQVHTLEVVEP